jgi:hypothetical protein
MERTKTSREIIAERLHGLVNPQYEKDAAELVRGRRTWRHWSNALEVSSKALAGTSTIMAFTASAITGQVVTDWLAFSSGCLGTASLVLAGFSAFSSKASSERTRELNVILQLMGVTPVPDLEKESMTETQQPYETTYDSTKRNTEITPQ